MGSVIVTSVSNVATTLLASASLSLGSRARGSRRTIPAGVIVAAAWCPFFSRVISVGAAQFSLGEERSGGGGDDDGGLAGCVRLARPGPRAERADGQMHNENEECPAEPDMKTSLRNGNGQDTGSDPDLTVPGWHPRISRRALPSESASLRAPSLRSTVPGTKFRGGGPSGSHVDGSSAFFAAARSCDRRRGVFFNAPGAPESGSR